MTAPVISWLPYQRRWLGDDSRFKIGMFTRRGGKTFGACGEIVDDMVQAEIAGRRTRWTILSRSQLTAEEALTEALKPMTRAYWEVYNTLLRGRGRPEFGETDFYSHELAATFKAFQVIFPGGSRATAISASPDSARGFGGNVLLDEFAFHRDSRRVWGAVYPVIIRDGHKLRVISTPNGKGNMFHQLMTSQQASKRWSRHHVDIYEAVAQGLAVDIDEIREGLLDEDAWAQEFELQWLDAASAWLDYDLITRAEDPAAGDPAGYQGGLCFVGEDIAARNDLFVLWVLEQVGDVLWTREVIARKRISFAEQDALRADVFRRYRVVRSAMDQTGMGEKPVEDAKRAHGDDRVEGVLFSPARKLDMATHLKGRFEDRTIRIPEGDDALRRDLHSVKKEVGPTGMARLLADREGGSHADRFWAAALAAAAAHSEYQPMTYEAAPGTRSRLAPAAGRDEDDNFPGRGRFGDARGAW